MIVSIIIPIYNAEKYLDRCIKSVLSQSYKELEIILVDDGSIDNSGKMCDKYAETDERIKILHKENGGLSSARNEGNLNATGKYFFYLDSDDFLSRECIKKLVDIAESNDAQIAITSMMYISEEVNDEVKSERKEEYIRILDSESAIEESLYQRLFSCCAPAKLYRKDVVEGIVFPVGRLSEDLATCHLFLNKADKIVYTSMVGYYYRQHKNSIMHTFDPKRMDALEWTIDIEEFCRSQYPLILIAAVCRTFNVAMHLLLDLPDSGSVHDKYYNEIWNEVKRTRLKTVLCRKVRIREKAAALLSYCGEKMLKKAWNSRIAVKREGN